MFKSILPSRRIPSADFLMITPPVDNSPNGKENHPGIPASHDTKPTRSEKNKKAKGKEHPVEGVPSEADFDRLLEELQIPLNLRSKLATMDARVKAQMLKSSGIITAKSSIARPQTSRGVRRAYSTESLGSPRPQLKRALEECDVFSSRKEPPILSPAHVRGISINVGRSAMHSFAPAQNAATKTAHKDKRARASSVSPGKYCNILRGNSSTSLEVDSVKKLRLLLRNEATTWTEEFLEQGGYGALLTRLTEILEVEWREEQHDDQMLHELLRCVKALSTSAIGCAALRDSCPSPYFQLIHLLYSDKKPGDVGTRQLILELLLLLFELYPSSSLPSSGSPITTAFSYMRSRSIPWEADARAQSSNLITLPAPHASLFSFIRALLLTPAPPPAEAPGPAVEPHAFIEELHRHRIYKTYLQELNDICRDFFWVFCHPNNAVWNLDETDEAKVEKPRAPGGMTGGVEFEAMGYMTTHFRFINAIAALVQDMNLPQSHEHSAYQFHNDMFLSGIERILLMARKASTTYYPTLHLEIARYVAAVNRSGFELPWSLSRLVAPPPSSMRKTPAMRSPVYGNLGKGVAMQGSPSKRSSVVVNAPVPGLPGSRKVTPMFGL
ncbi:hypothetical protein SCP_1200870 [Sparassis crispa]|uniref:Formin GTPase-binding domain-containing protein n=1 Tax=Sparassis crispa TaxID=139825 RepID=A0A401H0D2_9APHY|nr:hypothetical protein SCP_1200870 [Sparassis crispa]GBE87862.1 hypothetical protein SCP_1200870 [Sparassis crispa]